MIPIETHSLDYVSHFSMVPYILEDLNLDVYSYRLYMKLKMMCGQKNYCWPSLQVLADSCKMGLTTCKKAKQELCKPRKELGGKPLIYCKKRITETGQKSDVIYLLPLWKANAEKNNPEVFQNIFAGSRETTGGGSPDDHEIYSIEIDKKEKKLTKKEKENSEEHKQAQDLHDYLLEKMQTIDPHAKMPGTVHESVHQIFLLLVDDKRKSDLVRQVIDWMYTRDKFWLNKILSGKKLRQHFTQIYAQMMSEHKAQKTPAQIKADEIAKRVEWNKEYCKSEKIRTKVMRIVSANDYANSVKFTPGVVEIKHEGKYIPLGYAECGFRDKLEKCIGMVLGSLEKNHEF